MQLHFEKIVTQCPVGHTIDECLLAAIVLAREKGCDVEVLHNKSRYVVRFDEVKKLIDRIVAFVR